MFPRSGLIVLTVFVLVAGVLTSCDSGSGAVRVGGEETRERQIVIAGSSTIAPFVTTAAEFFAVTSEFNTPIVESTGTGGGFKFFCRGNGAETSSIATASRPITDGERELCERNNVNDVIELEFGRDGIVFINARSGPELRFTDRDLFRALAKTVLVDGVFVENPYEFWSEINPSLPDMRIEVYGPPPTSGTRDALVELVMERGARTFPELAEMEAADHERFKELSHTVRTDGRWLDAGENDTQIIQALIRNPQSVGVAGFSYLDQSGDRVKPAAIDDTIPTFNAITTEHYAVSRSLFLYVKRAHLEAHPELAAFLKEIYSEAAMSSTGYLVEKGLIPPAPDVRQSIRDQLAELSASLN